MKPKERSILCFIWVILIIFSLVGKSWGAGDSDSIPRLWIIVLGMNTDGKDMLNSIKQMQHYDPDCTLTIEESKWSTDDQIKLKIAEVTNKALQKGKDVIVIVDMDLEIKVPEFSPKYSGGMARFDVVGLAGQAAMLDLDTAEFILRYMGNRSRWFPAVDWAGRTMNLISQSFSDAGGQGKRIAVCHSAGCDGFKNSLRFAQSEKKKTSKYFDDAFLFNGRTNAAELGPLLKKSGYTPERVNLLLNKGDYAALPQVFNLVKGSISNLDAAKKDAGKWWTVYYGKDMPGRTMDHSVLVNDIRTAGDFDVYTGKNSYALNTTVEDILMGNTKTKQGKLRRTEHRERQKNDDKFYSKPPDPPPPPPDKFGGAAKPSLGGVLLEKKNSYSVDQTGKLTRIAEAALWSRPKKESAAWTFKHQGKTFKAVGIPTGKTNIEVVNQNATYWSDDQKMMILAQGDRIFVATFIQNHSHLRMAQIAEGTKRGVTSGGAIVFQINRIMLVDYGLN